jgi:hypothetical protein
MEKHITLVAVPNIGFGVMGLLFACLAFLVIAGEGIISGDPDAMIITMIVASATTIFFIIISLPVLIGGIGLLTQVTQLWGNKNIFRHQVGDCWDWTNSYHTR